LDVSLLAIMKKEFLSLMTILGALTESVLGNWDAAPLNVHEWGVNTFDLNTGMPLGGGPTGLSLHG